MTNKQLQEMLRGMPDNLPVKLFNGFKWGNRKRLPNIQEFSTENIMDTGDKYQDEDGNWQEENTMRCILINPPML